VLMSPWQSLSRKFAFTSLTDEPGVYHLLVVYNGIAQRESAYREGALLEVPTPVFARLDYQVVGEVLFERDDAGMILEKEAIRVASEKYGRRLLSSKAVLVQTESDLYDWWVTLERDPRYLKQGTSPLISCYVSPYGGFVRGETDPFEMDPGKYREVKREEAGQDAARPTTGLHEAK